jgi:hypothetical protein
MIFLVSQENPHGYWCRKCGRDRAYAEKHCSSANCKERRDAEDLDRENPRPDYTRWNMFEGP